MVRLKKFSLGLAIFLLLLSSLFHLNQTSNVTAVEKDKVNITQSDIDEAILHLSPIRFLPDHPLYFLISIKEQIEHIFKPNQIKKATFDVKRLGKRLKEAYLETDKNDKAKVESSLKKYNKIAKLLFNELNSSEKQNLSIDEAIDQLADTLTYHQILMIAIKQKQPVDDINEAENNLTNLIKLVIKNRPNQETKFQKFSIN